MYRFIFVILFLAINIKGYATHVYGGELFYEHITGNTYRLSLYLYGDCSGTAFNTLGSAPQVYVYNGTTLYRIMDLPILQPTTVEVTVACPAMAGQTKCNGAWHPLPGVKRFHYSDTLTLNAKSADWRFIFSGENRISTAGRSHSITNLGTFAGSSFVTEATLNNLTVDNNSVVFTSIPAPFFNINKPAEYNPGAVDSDGDSLAFSLVAGLTPYGVPYAPIGYGTGYSATNPVAVTPGSQSFDSTTCQLSFTPNLLQQSIVVTKAVEYRNGVEVGSAMREVTFVVLNYPNKSPYGVISSNNKGTLHQNKLVLDVCRVNDTLTFDINPVDSDGHNIDMIPEGLPTGATLTVTNNKSKTPNGKFVWNISNATLGRHVFYVSYIDDACPISAKQTIAYTINILPDPNVEVNFLSPPSCIQKAFVSFKPKGQTSPLDIELIQNNIVLDTFQNVIDSVTDSLSIGSYLLRIKNADSCLRDTMIHVQTPEIFINTIITEPLCNGDANGSIQINASGGLPGYTFALDTGAFNTGNNFNNLQQGTYLIKVKDQNSCTKDSLVTVSQPPELLFDSLNITDVTCFDGTDGVVRIVSKGGVGVHLYAINNSVFDTSEVRNYLSAGLHSVYVKDSNGCVTDSVIEVKQPIKVHPNLNVIKSLCTPVNNGTIVINTTGGFAPYLYSLNLLPYSGQTIFRQLAAGPYFLKVKDNKDCIVDTTVVIDDSIKVSGEITVEEVKCYGENSGQININATGGIAPYMYSLNAQQYNSAIIGSLKAGEYTVKISDSLSCEFDTVINVSSPNLLEVEVISEPNNCDKITNSGVLTALVEGGVKPYNYVWDNDQKEDNSSLENVKPGTHLFQVIDANGCLLKESVSMDYEECCYVFIPDAFTPNGDGLNDKVSVLFKNEFSLDLFSIYNRYGEQVFSTTSINDSWDGSWKGVLQNMGSYYYLVKGKCGVDKVVYKGSIILIK